MRVADMGNAIADLDLVILKMFQFPKRAQVAAALYGSRAGNGVVLITTRTRWRW